MIEVTACGKIINPLASHSQEIGGVVWGIGMALQEATEIDHRYGRIMNPNLQHYHVPVNADIHSIETIFVEEDDTDRQSARASRAWASSGWSGIPAAIANADLPRHGHDACGTCRSRRRSSCEQAPMPSAPTKRKGDVGGLMSQTNSSPKQSFDRCKCQLLRRGILPSGTPDHGCGRL